MALNINGYNTDFNAFVKFAQNSFVTNDKTVSMGSDPMDTDPMDTRRASKLKYAIIWRV